MIRRRVLCLAGIQLLFAGALATALILSGASFGVPWRVVALTGVFALVGLFPLHLELGRSACTILLVEAVLIVALFAIGPFGVAVAAGAGELVACLVLRLSPLKVLYSTASTATAVLAAALLFVRLGGSTLRAGDVSGWLVAMAAVSLFLLYNYTATSVVRSVVEGRRLTEVAGAAAGVYVLSSLVSASMGLVTVALFSLHPAATVLLIPLVTIAALETRQAAGHRAEHLRFERLYEASGRTTGLESLEQALGRSASEARNLVTGVASVCCVAGRDGSWTGVLVDDNGATAANPALVALAVALAADHGPGEIAAASVEPAIRRTLPAFATVMVAGDTIGDTPVVLAVFRELAPDDQGDARSMVLAAFVGHAGLTAANARLYEEVQLALAHQVDLNRQKDEFAAAVSHELRTPLAAMLTSIATIRRLKDRLDDNSTGRVLEMADRQGRRLKRLIDDLLTLASIEQSSAHMGAEPTDFAALVTEVADELSRLAPNPLTTDISSDIGTIASSGVRLRQILTNLIDNAHKYAPDSPIEVVGRRRGEQVHLAVIDHGPGIAFEDTERIFDRFVQLDQSATRHQGGTGLGLHLCRKIAELLDGTMVLSTTFGGGATFTLSIPAARLPEGTVGRIHRAAAQPNFAARPLLFAPKEPALAASVLKGSPS